MRDLAHDRRAQQDAADNFGDDARLAQLLQRIVKGTAENNDDTGLQRVSLAGRKQRARGSTWIMNMMMGSLGL